MKKICMIIFFALSIVSCSPYIVTKKAVEITFINTSSSKVTIRNSTYDELNFSLESLERKKVIIKVKAIPETLTIYEEGEEFVGYCYEKFTVRDNESMFILTPNVRTVKIVNKSIYDVEATWYASASTNKVTIPGDDYVFIKLPKKTESVCFFEKGEEFINTSEEFVLNSLIDKIELTPNCFKFIVYNKTLSDITVFCDEVYYVEDMMKIIEPFKTGSFIIRKNVLNTFHLFASGSYINPCDGRTSYSIQEENRIIDIKPSQ